MMRLTASLLLLCLCSHTSLAFTSNDNGFRIATTAENQYPCFTSLSALSEAKVLTVGDALFDCIANDDARGLTVDEMVKENKWTPFPGGAPTNVATACRKLGLPSAFCGCLGSDQDGDELESLLKDIGVDVSLLQRHDSSPTRRVMVTRSMEGDREFGGFYEDRDADGFADCYLDESQLLIADSSFEKLDWVVSSTLSLAFPQSAQSIRQVVQKAVEQGAKLYVDVNWRPVFWPNHPEEQARSEIMEFCQQASIVKLTDEEAEWLLPGISAAAALGDPRALHQRFFPNAIGVLVTAGEKGAAYSLFPETTDEEEMCMGKIEPFSVPAVETTGAGDAFTAGFLQALPAAMDEDPEFLSPKTNRKEVVHEIVNFAAAVGALTCTNDGAIAGQPTYDQVSSFLK